MRPWLLRKGLLVVLSLGAAPLEKDGPIASQLLLKPTTTPQREIPVMVPMLCDRSVQLDGAGLAPFEAPGEAEVPDDWYAAAMRDIASSEYHINYQEQVGTYQSPNRAQNMRITYHSDGFSLEPRVDTIGDGWRVDLALEHIGRPGAWLLPIDTATITADGPTLVADHGAFTIDYLNDERGMRQNFTVRERPAGEGPLTVSLAYHSDLHPADQGGNAIAFCTQAANGNSYTPIVWYKDLMVYDADGDTLLATASLHGDHIELAVNDEGASYPILIDPLSTTEAWMVESGQAFDFFGRVASAGDVNGDSFSDVIVGAFLFDNGQIDEGRAFVYHGSPIGLNPVAAWTAEGNQADAIFGYSVASAGDVNGDGYSDVIVGATGYSNGQFQEGRAFVFQGGPVGLALAPAWTAEGNQVDARFGHSVASAGDVNSDGFSDVIVGADLFENGQSNEGRALVYHGAAGGLAVGAAWTAESDQNGAQFGWSVACAGDVNGDGFSDVIIGAPAFANGQALEGRAFVYHGGAGAGLSLAPAWTAESDSPNASFGDCVASAGDVNGDGYSDVIIGALSFRVGFQTLGMVSVYHGGGVGVSPSANWTLVGSQNASSFGESVACAGDVNGDGYSDVIIGESLYDNGQADEGRASLYQGGSSGLAPSVSWTFESDLFAARLGICVASAGDVNGDGSSDVIVGASRYNIGATTGGRAYVFHGAPDGLSTSASWGGESDQASASYGFTVAGAGDVNGDGFNDVIIGAYRFDNGQTNEGRAFLYHGSIAGLPLAANWTTEGNQTSAFFGLSVSGAGDVNGDGYSDVIVGAPLFDNGQTNEGRAFVYHGAPGGLSTLASWVAESNQVDAQFGWDVAGAGDVNGNGFAEVIVSANLFDNGQVDEGRAFVYHGSAAGLSLAANWTSESDQAAAEHGTSVAGAGDVNGDGYNDVIVGAAKFFGGGINEGRAAVYHGGPAGLSAAINWTVESNQADAQFGYSVACAGDVNGDAFSDVIIGSPLYDNGEVDEGRAYVYHGSSTGLSLIAAWTLDRDQAGSNFGYCVSSAGDVNGDGYSDVVVGANLFDNGQTNEGVGSVFLGSPTGLSIALSSIGQADQAGASLGAVACAGDVNGDGYSDVIMGADGFDNGQADEGAAALYMGNKGGGLRHGLRLYNTNLTSPISASNIPVVQFGAGLFCKPFLGRSAARIVWETRIQGQAFSSAGGLLTNSVASTAQQAANALTALPGTELKNAVNKLTSANPITATKVRARQRYSMVTAITGQMFGPWRYMPGYLDGQGTHNNIPLPVELLYLHVDCKNGTAQLSWSTGSEHNSSHFLVERSANAAEWETAGRVEAAGNSQQLLQYTWTDPALVLAPVVYYRLRQVDLDGTQEVFDVLPLVHCTAKASTMLAYPNPATDQLTVTAMGCGDATGTLELRDATGRAVRRRSLALGTDHVSANLDLNGIEAGAYLLHLLDAVGNPLQQLRVVKQ